MRLLVFGLMITFLLAGCAKETESPPPNTEDPQPEPATVNHKQAPARPTPGINLTLGQGDWDLSLEGTGIRAFRLNLLEDMQQGGYAIGGTIRMLIVPVGHQLDGCRESTIYLLATGTPDFTQTDGDLPAGSYDVIMSGDGSGSMQWRVGSSDEEREATTPASSTNWKVTEMAATVTDGQFEETVPAGYGFAAFSASSPLLRNEDATHQQIAAPELCHEADDERGTGLLGTTLRTNMHFESNRTVIWSGEHAGSGNVDGESSYEAEVVLFIPPELA